MPPSFPQCCCRPGSKCRGSILPPSKQTCAMNQVQCGPSPPPVHIYPSPPFPWFHVPVLIITHGSHSDWHLYSHNAHLHFKNVLPAGGQEFNYPHSPRSWTMHPWTNAFKWASVNGGPVPPLLKSGAVEGLPLWGIVIFVPALGGERLPLMLLC